jgi:hypothetical protein
LIFTLQEIQENYHHPELQHNESGRPMELDIFLPKERLAFEYQGEQHYHDIYLLGSAWNQKERDEEKRILCREKKITLIEIPYWWDKQSPSLASTIRKERSDLLTTYQIDTDIEPILTERISEGETISNNFNLQTNRFINTNDAWNRMGWNSKP